MKAKPSDWYRNGWTLDIKGQSWTENTEAEVDFILRALDLPKGARVLDLACGYGRHALSLARRGYRVTGVDITPCYIEDAQNTAQAEGLPAEFLLSDIRDVSFCGEFDAVLNLADGAIGYLETDEENLKIFDVISRALKSGGAHFMDVMNGEHADRFYPTTKWEAGEIALSLAEFDWDPVTRRMLFGGYDIPYGSTAQKPVIPAGDPTRLYTPEELRQIFACRGMEIESMWSDYTGNAPSPIKPQLMVLSRKI